MWPQIITSLLGAWVMAAPDVLGYADPARTHDHVVGPLIVTVAMIATSEATRPVRWLNVLFGLWMVVAPSILGYESSATVNSLLAGMAVTAFSLIRGRIKERFGGGWSVLLSRRS